MNVAVALALLAWVDCMLCGFRMAAGRNGRIDKRVYYMRSVARAAIVGAVVVGAHAALVVLLCLTAPDPRAAWGSFIEAGRPAVAVYAVFATAIFVAFGFYFAPIGCFRVLTDILVFGPLTLARPAVIAGGLVLAVWHVPEWRVALVAISAALAMNAFEPVLGRHFARLWTELVPGSDLRESRPLI